jgi:hypothetical protein
MEGNVIGGLAVPHIEVEIQRLGSKHHSCKDFERKVLKRSFEREKEK